jgi:hypothetical protein
MAKHITKNSGKNMSENYHLEEQYVKIIFNYIHNTRVSKDMQWTETPDNVQ